MTITIIWKKSNSYWSDIKGIYNIIVQVLNDIRARKMQFTFCVPPWHLLQNQISCHLSALVLVRMKMMTA